MVHVIGLQIAQNSGIELFHLLNYIELPTYTNYKYSNWIALQITLFDQFAPIFPKHNRVAMFNLSQIKSN